MASADSATMAPEDVVEIMKMIKSGCEREGCVYETYQSPCTKVECLGVDTETLSKLSEGEDSKAFIKIKDNYVVPLKTGNFAVIQRGEQGSLKNQGVLTKEVLSTRCGGLFTSSFQERIDAYIGRRDLAIKLPVETKLFVQGICCPSEVPLVHRLLDDVKGVEDVTVNVTSKTCVVKHRPDDVSPIQLVNILNQGGLGARISSANVTIENENILPRKSVIVGCILWLLSLLSVFGGYFVYFEYFALFAIACAVPTVAIRAFNSMMNGVLDVNSLMLFASAGALFIGKLCEAAAVVVLFALSEWLETRATSRVRSALASVLSLKPEEAIVSKTKEMIKADLVEIGMCLDVPTGSKIPVDGVIVSGNAMVDESMITGESVPVRKEEKDIVRAGTMIVDGFIVMEATAVSKDSTVTKLAKLVEQAQSARSPTEKMISSIAKYYTPIVVFGAILIALLPCLIYPNAPSEFHYRWVHQALVLLVIACPCALLISTPLSYICAIAVGASNQVLIKGGIHLEAMARVKTLAFDKTGTLTVGSFVVTGFHLLVPKKKKEILKAVKAIESQSTHPIGRALALYAKQSLEKHEDVKAATDFKIEEGEGISAIWNGKKVHILSTKGITSRGYIRSVDKSPIEKGAQWEKEGRTVGWVCFDKVPVASFSVSDFIRPEAKNVVQSMQQRGISIVMLTGDNHGSALKISKDLGGLDDVRSQLLPKDKIESILYLKNELQSNRGCFASKGKVCMIGDGVNDTPALAISDVGIAMGAGGAPMAMETAHVILLDSNLLKLEWTFALSRATLSKIFQNVIISLVSKVVMISLAALNMSTLWLAILSDIGTMLLVTSNSTMLLNMKFNDGESNNNDNCIAENIENAAKLTEMKTTKLCGSKKSGCCDGGDVKSSSDCCATTVKDDEKSCCNESGCYEEKAPTSCCSDEGCNKKVVPVTSCCDDKGCGKGRKEESSVHVEEKTSCCGSNENEENTKHSGTPDWDNFLDDMFN